jgi:hypothetical protein
MTLVEQITANARWWLNVYREAAEISKLAGRHDQSIAKCTAQTLCPHHNLIQSGTLFKCADCGAHSR